MQYIIFNTLNTDINVPSVISRFGFDDMLLNTGLTVVNK